ncbi:hypothetical phage protein [Campylobacter phage CP220]|uniref:Hypothetical phage protein n=1 Tax=Campylobacter phage CP220 TaxID=2994044 RepID=D5GVG5_9CAUD|nr:hypothetical protein APL47_gp147 [Campylobacter phage CP220]QXO06287.1 hypothetical protein [Campylobacter phage CJLB-12]CBJ93982.1 hypothetical phage protein [Campylobacter phage CP220]
MIVPTKDFLKDIIWKHHYYFLIHFIKENRDIYIVFIIINKVR